MDDTEARRFFDELGNDIVSGNIFAVLSRVKVPMAIYLGHRAFVFRHRDLMLRGLQAYHGLLVSQGVARCSVDVVRATRRRGADVCFEVRAGYLDARGGMVGESSSNYFLSDGKAAPLITMIEIDQLPVDIDALNFDPGAFE